ncbi:MAG: two-component sensor histidine kinase, partial [Desulfococcus multivorans]|nr:two-component sensor histidine kinase [Desulfococcus multivorans]
MKTDLRTRPQEDLYRKLKWLIFFRALFAAVLLGSAILVGLHGRLAVRSHPLFSIYCISGAMLGLSGAYAVFLPRIRRVMRFGYAQIFIDSLLITAIIFVTGSFSSIFSFLYLVVIIYGGMVLSRTGA